MPSELPAPRGYAEDQAQFRSKKSPKPAVSKSTRLLSPLGSGAVRYPSPPMSEPQPSPGHPTDRPEESAVHPSPATKGASPVKEALEGGDVPSTRPTEAPAEHRSQSHSLKRPATPSSQQSSAESAPPLFQALSGAGQPPSTTSGDDTGTSAQLTAVTNSPSPRPSRAARRTKAHVPSACVNCKRAHLSCDVQRPCTRCVTSGKQDTCYDVQHKKRGRPRLRDRADAGHVDPTGAHMRVDQQSQLGAMGPTASPSLPQPEPFRVLRAREVRGRSLSPHAGEMMYGAMDSDLRRATITSHPYQPSPQAHHPPPPPPPPPGAHPVAFMNLDLSILKANRSFQDFLNRGNAVVNRDVSEFVDARQVDLLQRLRTELREEKEARDPAYMPPIFGGGEQGAIEAVSEHDLDRISVGFLERQDHWTFVPRDGPAQTMRVVVRLAKTTVFFVTLLVLPIDIPPRPHSAYSSHAPPKPLAPADSSPRLPSMLRGRDPGHFSRPSTAASDSPPPYYTSPTIASSIPHTPLQHPTPYGRPQTPGGYSPAYPTTLPPPIPHSSYGPVPPPSGSLDRPGSRHSASSTEVAPQSESRFQYQLPPLRSGTPHMSPPSRPRSSWTPRPPSSAPLDTPTSTPARAETQGQGYSGTGQRQYSSPPGDDTASSGSGEGPNKRRRLTIGIHDLTD